LKGIKKRSEIKEKLIMMTELKIIFLKNLKMIGLLKKYLEELSYFIVMLIWIITFLMFVWKLYIHTFMQKKIEN